MSNYWYIIHTYSGHENKVRINLEQRLRSRGLQNEGDKKQFEVYIPTQEVTEIREGKKKTYIRTIYPGYVLIQLENNLIDELQHDIRTTPGVMGFVGSTSASKPIPLNENEVQNIFQQPQGEEAQKPVPTVSFVTGDKVKVIDGPFTGFTGEVDEINMEKQKLKIMISIFGRSTPIELEFFQVEKT